MSLYIGFVLTLSLDTQAQAAKLGTCCWLATNYGNRVKCVSC